MIFSMSGERIIRGYVFPRRGPVYVEAVTDGEEILSDLLSLLRDGIECFMKCNKINRIRETDDLEGALNSAICYIKTLGNIDPEPELIRSITPLLYIVYSLFRSELKRGEINPIDEGFSYVSRLYDRKLFGEILDNLKRMYSDEAVDKLLNVMRFPADTRPGANTSSLLVHSLTTSAIASSILLNSDSAASKEDLVALRIAALFHDLGKTINWHRHESLSVKIIHDFFDNIVEGKAASLISKACNIIADRRNPLHNLLNKADRISSGTDRLLHLFYNILEKYGGKLYEKFQNKLLEFSGETQLSRKKIFEVLNEWDFWNSLDEEYVKRLTEFFCRQTTIINGDKSFMKVYESMGGDGEAKADENIVVTRFDARHIQSIVKNNDIRAMSAGSRLVDLAMYVSLPVTLIWNEGIPPENLLCWGGGNLTAIIPKKLGTKLKDAMEKINRKGGIFRLVKFSCVFTPLYQSTFKTLRELDRATAIEKLSEGHFDVKNNLGKLCELCGSKIATATLPDGSDVCDTCELKYRLGSDQHFRVKLEAFFGREKAEQLLQKAIEFIAGWWEENDSVPDLSVVRIDGNLTGMLISSSLSLTDLVERSIRIDFSLKKAFRSFISILEKDDRCRLICGTLYLGGDDATILLPSRLSIPFSMHMLNEYYLEMGGRHTLSAGIMTVKAKHPIIQAYECAGELLSIAKKETREETSRMYYEHPDNSFRGSLAFFVSEVSTADVAMKTAIKYLDEKGLSNKAYTLSPSIHETSIFRLLKPALIKINGLKDKIELDALNSKDFVNAINDIYRRECEEIKDVRNEILKSTLVTFREGELKAKIVFTARNVGRRESESEVGKSLLCNILHFKDDKLIFALHDLYMLLKILSGGKL